jgi:hypothetical protein
MLHVFSTVSAVGLPHWSWDTLQTYVHCANRTGIYWSDAALQVIAKQAFVVFEKNHGLWAQDATRGLWVNTTAEDKIVAACEQVKSIAPHVQCLMYTETDWARTYYSLGHTFDGQPELELHAAAGWRPNTTDVQRVSSGYGPINGSTQFSYQVRRAPCAAFTHPPDDASFFRWLAPPPPSSSRTTSAKPLRGSCGFAV